MIHELGREVEALLVAQGCPFKVIDREGTKPTAWRNVIVLENMPDTFGPARSQSLNPRRYWTRNVGAKLTIYAQSTKSGALEFEHRRLAEAVLDLVLVALRKACAVRKIGLALAGGRFVTVEDLANSERQGGAVYELSFSVERGVADRTWSGAIAEEWTVPSGGFVNSTAVSRATVLEDDGDPTTPETACGA